MTSVCWYLGIAAAATAAALRYLGLDEVAAAVLALAAALCGGAIGAGIAGVKR